MRWLAMAAWAGCTLLAAAVIVLSLASCSTEHRIVGPCIPLDSITVTDSVIRFHKDPACR